MLELISLKKYFKNNIIIFINKEVRFFYLIFKEKRAFIILKVTKIDLSLFYLRIKWLI